MEGDGSWGAGAQQFAGYGGFASNTNPFWDNVMGDSAADKFAKANPSALVSMGDNGGYYASNNYTGPDGNGAPVYGETPWWGYDQSGKQTSAGVHQKAKFNDLALMAVLSAVGMGMFLPGMVGGAGAAGGAGAGVGAGAAGAEAGAAGAAAGAGGTGGWGAGLGMEGLGTGTFDAGLGSIADAGIVGSAASAPSVSVPWIPGGVGQVGGALPSVGAATGGMGIGSSFLGAGGTGVTPAAGGGFMNTVEAIGNNPMVKGASLASTVSNLAGGSKQSGISGTDLAGILAGIMDYRGNKGSSEDMLGYMREQQGKIDNLFAPGSEEWNSLWQAMERKDAAAGRNSQYGPRSVDFLGKIADTKAKYTAELTKGLASNYGKAFDQANLGTGAAASGAVKALLKNPENLSSIVSGMQKVGSGIKDGISSFDDFMTGLFD